MHTLPLITGEDLEIPDEWTETWGRFYSFDFVEKEIPRAIIWCIDNPRKKKTGNGARRYLGSWLARAWAKEDHHKMKELS